MYKKSVSISSLTFISTVLIPGRNKQDMIIKIFTYSCKVPDISVQF